jgi:hypothetical protein
MDEIIPSVLMILRLVVKPALLQNCAMLIPGVSADISIRMEVPEISFRRFVSPQAKNNLTSSRYSSDRMLSRSVTDWGKPEFQPQE